MPFVYALIAAICTYYALRFHLAWPLIFTGVEQALASGAIKFDEAAQRAAGITQAGFAARTANTYVQYPVNIGAVIGFITAGMLGRIGWLSTLAGAFAGTAAGGVMAYLIGTGYLR